MLGVPLSEMALQVTREGTVAVKAVVLPFDKFPTLVPVLGPEMQSTGESMGVGSDFETAFAKAQLGAGRHQAAKAAHQNTEKVERDREGAPTQRGG
jgi:carbamoyl-phosphate synthase large subunit